MVGGSMGYTYIASYFIRWGYGSSLPIKFSINIPDVHYHIYNVQWWALQYLSIYLSIYLFSPTSPDNCNKLIYPGATSFSTAKEFRVIPSTQRSVASPSSIESSKGLEYTISNRKHLTVSSSPFSAPHHWPGFNLISEIPLPSSINFRGSLHCQLVAFLLPLMSPSCIPTFLTTRMSQPAGIFSTQE